MTNSLQIPMNITAFFMNCLACCCGVERVISTLCHTLKLVQNILAFQIGTLDFNRNEG